MKSFCIKNNNDKILDYLLKEFKNMDLDNVYISKGAFKYYKNIIIHYKGSTEKIFILKLSHILTNCIKKFYEDNIIRRLINCDYFYFENKEKDIIFNNAKSILLNDNDHESEIMDEKIFVCLYEYICKNKFFILDGFVNFRLFEYTALLEEIVDMAVNKYIIDKEYKEFITMLQSYINSQSSRTGTIHIIYSTGEPIILDSNQNVIPYNTFVYPKYLSDITFSSNDYCLNALLNLLPSKIIIHMLVEEDEFVNTLKLIFGKRLMICKECNICKTFELLNVH